MTIRIDREKSIQRIEIDPNSRSRKYPGMVPVRLEDHRGSPHVGEHVIAVQAEDDEPDFVGLAVVCNVDEAAGLLYLDVKWDSFADDVAPAPTGQVAMMKIVYSQKIRGLVSSGRSSSEFSLTSPHGIAA